MTDYNLIESSLNDDQDKNTYDGYFDSDSDLDYDDIDYYADSDYSDDDCIDHYIDNRLYEDTDIIPNDPWAEYRYDFGPNDLPICPICGKECQKLYRMKSNNKFTKLCFCVLRLGFCEKCVQYKLRLNKDAYEMYGINLCRIYCKSCSRYLLIYNPLEIWNKISFSTWVNPYI